MIKLPEIGTSKLIKLPPLTIPKPEPILPGVPAAIKYFPGTMKTLEELQIDPLNLKADPKQTISAAWEGLKGSVVQEVGNIKDLFQKGFRIKGEPAPTSEVVGAGLRAVAGTGNVIFSPITALFEGANKVPVLGSLSKLISLPFSVGGEALGDISDKIIDESPLPENVKKNIKQGAREIASLSGMLLVGKGIEIAGKEYLPSEKTAKSFKDDFISNYPEYVSDMNKIGTNRINKLIKDYGIDDAKTIVKKSIETAKEKRGEPIIEPIKITLPPIEKISTEVKVPEQIPKVETIPVTPEFGIPKTAKDIEARTIADKMEIELGELPTYKTMSMMDQAKKALDLIEQDKEKAIRIARGDEVAPGDLRPGSVFTALREKAFKDKDVGTILELSKSKVATEIAQGLKAFDVIKGEIDVVDKIKEVRKSREGKIKDTEKVKLKEVENIKSEIKKTSPTKETWSSFIKSLEC